MRPLTKQPTSGTGHSLAFSKSWRIQLLCVARKRRLAKGRPASLLMNYHYQIRDKVSSFVNHTSASFPPSLSLTLQVLQGQVSARIQLFLAVDDKEKEGFWATPGCEKLQRLRRRQNKDVMGGGLDRWRAAASSSVSTSSNVNAGSAAAGVSSSLTPCVGDRIMVLKTRWLQCILNGTKTIELRGRQARLGRVWLGVGSEVHSGAATIARLMLTCRVQLRGLYGWQMC